MFGARDPGFSCFFRCDNILVVVVVVVDDDDDEDNNNNDDDDVAVAVVFFLPSFGFATAGTISITAPMIPR